MHSEDHCRDEEEEHPSNTSPKTILAKQNSRGGGIVDGGHWATSTHIILHCRLYMVHILIHISQEVLRKPLHQLKNTIVLSKLCLADEIDNCLPQAGLIKLEVLVESSCGPLQVPCQGTDGCHPTLEALGVSLSATEELARSHSCSLAFWDKISTFVLTRMSRFSWAIWKLSFGALPGGYKCSRFEKSAAMENTSECIGSLSGSHTRISLALPTTKRTVVQVMITAENRNVIHVTMKEPLSLYNTKFVSKAKQMKSCEHPHTHHMSQDAPVDLWHDDASSGRRPQQPNTTPSVKHSVITSSRMHSPMDPQYLHHHIIY
ncbi:hypothetical protein E2C01_019537 [Portunus trituberculatus]|uniref:Uncharacterized protein n=1 Tax=Portunus trituberculatus TaxID=210409 RepID=A0A5B7DXH2_PORTR|nr:hypothetical protein [Portunus trituberculatus]